MLIYLDSDFKCHLTNDGTMMEYETDFFDGKCDVFIEGHRIVPEGCVWKNSIKSNGTMITAWKNYDILKAAQSVYEEMDSSLTVLKKENEMLTNCLLEMSEIVYA